MWQTSKDGLALHSDLDHIRLMDEQKIRLFLDGDSPARWSWELWLRGKKVAGGKPVDTQEKAFTAAREALNKYRKRQAARV